MDCLETEKGHLKALLEFAYAHPEMCEGLSIDEHDLAPYGAKNQSALPGVYTTQWVHDEDKVSGQDEMSRVNEYHSQYPDEGHGHYNIDFFSIILNLPEGNYVFSNGKFVQQ